MLAIVTFFSGTSPDFSDPDAGEVVLTAERVQQLEGEWQRHLGRPPTPEEEDTLLAKSVEDELFFAEAMTRDLHRQDPRIRGRLMSLLRFSGTETPSNAPSDDSVNDQLDAAVELELHQRDALVHGWLVALGEAVETADGSSREEALQRLRQKFRVRIERPTEGDP